VTAFESVEDLNRRFEAQDYFCDEHSATALYLAERLGKPLLVEGPPGVGKTEIAKTLATVTGRRLVRLQCYEGIDESRALYEWEYTKQLLYTQMLKERIGDLLASADTLEEAVSRLDDQGGAFFSRSFLLPRPLLDAILSPEPVVLLIDEVDRSDEEFESFLLETLGEFQVTVPELGTLSAVHRPLALLTSNATRTLSEALRRRCLFLHIDYPDAEQEARIVHRKVPGMSHHLAQEAVRFVNKVRQSGVRKPPSISETLDWALALVVLNAGALDHQVLAASLGALLKDKEDIERVLRQGIH
jgi:MoxR-like ATPase